MCRPADKVPSQCEPPQAFLRCHGEIENIFKTADIRNTLDRYLLGLPTF